MLSHLEPDGPVRLDGVKLALTELMGLELDAPKLGAFAGLLNALRLPPAAAWSVSTRPSWAGCGASWNRRSPPTCPSRRRPRPRCPSADCCRSWSRARASSTGASTRSARRSTRPSCAVLLARTGLTIHPLEGETLERFVIASALGGSPAERDREEPVEVRAQPARHQASATRLARALHLSKWPRSLAPGFLQQLMATGAPMDIALHLGPNPVRAGRAPAGVAGRSRFESARSLSLRRGKTMSPEAEIALEDVSRLSDDVQRGRERLFHASLSADPARRTTTDDADGANPARLGPLRGRPGPARSPCPSARGKGLLSTQPLALNAVAHWRTLDTLLRRPLLPLLAARSRHPFGRALRDRHARLRPDRLRPLGRHAPERQHRRAGPVRLG